MWMFENVWDYLFKVMIKRLKNPNINHTDEKHAEMDIVQGV